MGLSIYAFAKAKAVFFLAELGLVPPQLFFLQKLCFHFEQIIYAGDSAADELAISRLKGVAHTFRVINEDSTVITKTVADYRLEGESRQTP